MSRFYSGLAMGGLAGCLSLLIAGNGEAVKFVAPIAVVGVVGYLATAK